MSVASESAARETGAEEDFGALFEQSLKAVEAGRSRRGRVVQIARDLVTVDIGFKSEGQIPIHEFRDRDGTIEVTGRRRRRRLLRGERQASTGGIQPLARQGASSSRCGATSRRPSNDGGADRRADRRQGEGRPQGRHRRRRRSCPARTPTCGRRATSIATSARRGRFAILKFNRSRGNVVVSRRAVLERERTPLKEETLQACSRRASSSRAPSRTSPTTARSSTSAASTACCTSPTCRGAASRTRPR